jgi:hypothetical protein
MPNPPKNRISLFKAFYILGERHIYQVHLRIINNCGGVTGSTLDTKFTFGIVDATIVIE